MVKNLIKALCALLLITSVAKADFTQELSQDTNIWQAINRYTDGVIEQSLNDLIHGKTTYGNLRPFNEYRVKYFNNAITGGAGAGSGVTYIPEVGLWLFDDNNALVLSVYRETDLTTEWGNWTLSGFNDPEWSEYMGMTYDANGQPENVILAIGEESCSVGQGCAAGSQEFVICTVPVNTATQTITKGGAACTRIQFSSAWTNDTTLGAEAGCYDPYRKVMWVFKQDTPFEARAVPIDGSTTPVATEPFDAETLWSATIPSINDCMFDKTTRTIKIISDATGADSNNQDIITINPGTGAVIENYQSYTDTLGLNLDTRTDFPQGEGIDCTPDMRYCMVASETDQFAFLERVPPSAYYNELFINPADAVVDDTAPPGAAVVESTGVGTPRRNTLAFDPTTDEIAYLSFIVPQDFRVTATPMILDIYWYANSITAAADAIWSAQVSCTTASDADSMIEDATTALASAMTVATVTNLTEANRLNTSSITLSTDDSVAAGDYCTITFLRDADDTIGNADNDGLTVDAIVIGWRLRLPRF